MNTLRFSSRAIISACTTLSLAASAVAQPPSITYDLSWTPMPSSWLLYLPFQESVRFSLTAQVWPPVGTVITHPSLPAGSGGVGTIAGLGAIAFDIRACAINNGTWTISGSGFNGTTGANWGVRSGWSLGSSFAGTPQPNGDLTNCAAGQFVPPGSTANALNPIAEIWRAKWQPLTYDPGRAFRFNLVPASSTIIVRILINGEPTYAGIEANPASSFANIIVDPGAPGSCAPNITSVPQNTVSSIGHAATFAIQASRPASCGPVTYRWRKGCTNLVDDGRITGSNSPILRIFPVTAADAGQYDVSVNSVVDFFARPVWLTLGCYANCDQSTSSPTLTVYDFQCFLSSYAAGSSIANCDESTTPPILTANDFQCFLNQYAAGCP